MIFMKYYGKSRCKMVQKVLIVIIFVLLQDVSGNRVRRHLVFSEGSRLFFSVDVRDNLFNYSDFFAQVFGFKIDWDLPSGLVRDSSRGRVQRRDLYQGMEYFLFQQKLNGTSCIRKFLCEASIILPKSRHFLSQFFEVVFPVSDGEICDVYSIKNVNAECRKILIKEECPLSLTSIFHRGKSNFNILEN